jgi:hypothetical protein
MGCSYLTDLLVRINFTIYINTKVMKAFYQITSEETGTVILKRRRIAKGLRWWLRQNDITFTCVCQVK